MIVGRWTVAVFAIFCAVASSARETVVWEGEKTIDRVVKILAKDILVKPGATVRFVGNGRIDLREGTLAATNAALLAEGVITNAWRVSVVNGGLRLEGCRMRGLNAVDPIKDQKWYVGSVRVQGAPVRIAGCDVEDSSGIAIVNTKDAEVAHNVFVGCNPGVFAFQTKEGRLADNEFVGCHVEALRVNAAQETEFANNRFTDCGSGIVNFAARRCQFIGNSFFGGSSGIVSWWSVTGNLYSANLFEDVKGAAFSVLQPLGADNVFANNVVSRCGYGWSLGKQKPKTRIVIRDNAILETTTGISIVEGVVGAPNNAIWNVKTPISVKDEAKVSALGLVTDDPLFKDSARGDYRLKSDSPLLNAGSTGGSIGLYQ